MNTSVLLCLLGILAFYQSYKQFQKNKYKFSIIYILLGGSLLRWTGVKDPYIHAWDERYHFLVAKNLLNNWLEPKLYPYPLLEYDYTHWGANYIWLHKPPFALWTIAASFKLFGINELAGRLPSFCFSIACILLTYYIGLLLFKNQKLALLAAFFHAINGLVIEISVGRITTDHIDTTFFFFLDYKMTVLILVMKITLLTLILLPILQKIKVFNIMKILMFGKNNNRKKKLL